jgi:hypothetical protein
VGSMIGTAFLLQITKLWQSSGLYDGIMFTINNLPQKKQNKAKQILSTIM